ncbi:fledgling of Klp38B [Lycorma delicatula]|uniref:fledgling of Klp38B n=1 Tax=Lycorma delicatula TaxID=130591 RepID=UPI003F50D607
MDLIYMSDAMAYQTARGPLSYYDRSWDQKNTKKTQDKRKKTSSWIVQTDNGSGSSRSTKTHHKTSGEACKICKEQQRRSLRVYIRSKSIEEPDSRCIVEENEEEEENGEEEVHRHGTETVPNKNI